MSDATARTLARFDDASQWNIHRGVALFDQHEGYGQAELDRICCISNRRETETGDACPVFCGRKPADSAPETEYPDIVGWARSFRMGQTRAGKPAIVADLYLEPNQSCRVKKFNRVACELWRDGVLDPIWLADCDQEKKDRNDLGLLTYQKRLDRRICYAKDYLNMCCDREEPAAPNLASLENLENKNASLRRRIEAMESKSQYSRRDVDRAVQLSTETGKDYRACLDEARAETLVGARVAQLSRYGREMEQAIQSRPAGPWGSVASSNDQIARDRERRLAAVARDQHSEPDPGPPEIVIPGSGGMTTQQYVEASADLPTMQEALRICTADGCNYEEGLRRAVRRRRGEPQTYGVKTEERAREIMQAVPGITWDQALRSAESVGQQGASGFSAMGSY